MKIVYVAESTVPSRTANSVHVMSMCQSLSDIGHDVTLIVPDRPSAEESIGQSVYSFYDVRPNFDIEKLPYQSSGIPGPSGPLGFGFAIAGRILRLRPDLVYGRSLVGCTFVAAVGRPTMFEIHVPMSMDGLDGYLFPLLLRTPGFEKLVVISEALREEYLSEFPELNGRIVVAHDGADPIEKEPLELKEVRSDPDEDTVNVGYVGHLYDGKGMEIISEIVADCPFADFHIIGGTEDDLAHWEEKMGQQPNLQFYGFQPHSRALRYLLSLDIAISPYQRVVSGANAETNLSRWMSPLKIFEYMAAGKAIVSSDLPVLREVLTHEETALMADPDSPQEWVASLRRLSDDAELRRYLGENAKAQFEEQYTWRRRAEKLVGEVR